MINTGLKKGLENDPRNVDFSELELGNSDNKTRWGMSDKDIKKLTKKNQRSHPSCVGHTIASGLEGATGKEYHAGYAYVNTDRIYEGGNKGGLFHLNGYRFAKTFGLVREKEIKLDTKDDFDEYYEEMPGINIKEDKTYIKSFMTIGNKLDLIKKALDELDMVSISVYKFKSSRGRHFGKWLRRFYPDATKSGGHAMKVAYMELVDGKHHVYVWNSWGRGLAMLVLEDFPLGSINFYGGSMDEDIEAKVKDIVVVKKQALPKYKYFQPYEVINLVPEFVQKLDEARGIAGVSFIITSGYRSPAKNKAVGGVANSAHLKGLAVDLKCTTSANRFKIVNALRQVGFTRIGIAKTFIHVDMDTTKSQNVYWLY